MRVSISAKKKFGDKRRLDDLIEIYTDKFGSTPQTLNMLTSQAIELIETALRSNKPYTLEDIGFTEGYLS